MNASHLLQPKYRPDIDGLRAIAVLSVVIFHAFPTLLKGGFLGVDVFFVISGFLISTIIFENLDNGKFNFIEFYGRRIKRIFPALLLVLISSYSLGWFILLADEYAQLGKHIASGAGFISNIVLWKEAGYFDNAANTKPLLHLWSLGIEEQFYIIWPLFIWFFWKQRFNFLTIMVLVAALSFYLNIKGVKQGSIATFYSPQTRFWELLSGSFLAGLMSYEKEAFDALKRKLDTWLSILIYKNPSEPDGNTLNSILAFIGLFLLAYGFWRVNKEFRIPGKWAVIPVLGALLVISAGPTTWINRKVLSNRYVVWCGLISFPLYLWHWPLLSFARIIMSEIPSRSVRITIVGFSIILAHFTYKLLEKRIRLGSYATAKVLTLFMLMTLVGGLGYYTYSQHGLAFRNSIVQTGIVNAEFVGPLWKYTKNDICQNKYPLKGSEKYAWWFCMASSIEKPTLLLLGNSYANHFFAGIVNNPYLQKHSVLSIGTCDASWREKSELIDGVENWPCTGHRPYDQMKFINKIVRSEHSIRYAIISGIREKPNLVYINQLRKRIDFLEKNKVKVILFVPHVKIDYDIKGCFARPFAKSKQTCEVDIGVYKNIRKDFDVLAKAIQKTNPSVLVFDPNQLFCDDRKCSFKLNGMPLFRDEFSHFSEYASNQLITRFANWATTNAPGLLG